MIRKLFVATLILFSFSAITSNALAASSVITKLSTSITLEESGKVLVRQDIYYAGKRKLDWQVFNNFRQLHVFADSSELSTAAINVKSSGKNNQIIAKQHTAEHWRLSYVASNSLIRHDDRDQLFLKLIDQPGQSILAFDAKLTLPSNQGEIKDLNGNLYVIGGVSAATTETVSNNEITFSTEQIGQGALLTLNASWPKSVLNLTNAQEFRLSLSNLDIIPWLLIGLFLPLMALLVLTLLLLRNNSHNFVRSSSITDKPPSNISPAIIGVLVDKKIKPRTVTSLIVDLCQRDYLVLIKKGSDFYLGRRKVNDEHLQNWEREIIDELIPESSLKTNDQKLRSLSKQTLFSPKIKLAFQEIYETVTKNGYFTENPHQTRVRSKLIGLAIYYIGLFGIIWLIVSAGSSYLLIPLIGTIFIAWLILRLSPELVNYSQRGLDQKKEWLTFANYLESLEPIDARLTRNQTFEKYLPYAVSLNCTEEWADRFDRSDAVKVRPDWFISYQDSSTSEFTDDLIEFADKISTILSDLRGPLVN